MIVRTARSWRVKCRGPNTLPAKATNTRLPSNLRPTSHDCVHLVTRGHIRSCDKDGSHAIQSAPAENPMLHTNLTALSAIEPELWSIKILHCRNKNFRPFLLLWPWSWPDDLHVWTSYVKASESYRLTDRQTDTTEIIYHAASRVVNKAVCILTIGWVCILEVNRSKVKVTRPHIRHKMYERVLEHLSNFNLLCWNTVNYSLTTKIVHYDVVFPLWELWCHAK